MGQQAQAFSQDLVLDAHYEASGQASFSCRKLGQEFVPTYDNVAAITALLVTDALLLGGSFATLKVDILDASGAELGSVFPTLRDPTPIVELSAEFDSPIAVVPGELHVLALNLPFIPLEGGLDNTLFSWIGDTFGTYEEGGALSDCDGDGTWTRSQFLGQDFHFATYAAVETPTFSDADDVLATASPDPAQGQMTGPNENANAGRLNAFENMMDEAEAAFLAGETAQGCSKLGAARNKVTGDNAWFAGETAASLLEIIDALAAENGCS